ncbi:MAG: stage 0 sporulation family protein [Oscillospiraceae bacterium]|nr:stage 0 sporulation family protein [Oscillospiraceae bacterium]
MAEIIGVRFKSVGKVYYFDPDGYKVAKGENVIVETSRGIECGEVILGNRAVDDKQVTQPLKKMLRPASTQDIEKLEKNRERESFALKMCQEKVRNHNLDMKLIDVEYTFDNSKVLFYFTADGRVDFRELVKDLASILKTRIELRQIGVRDEAKMLGGLGICGRPFCCSTFLGEFQPVSIKMAKEQGLSLNPAKISGTCGRLMCCLKYEQAAYEDLLKTTPKAGAAVQTPEGKGIVGEVSLMTGNLKVALEKNQNGALTVFHKDQVRPFKEARTHDKTDAHPSEKPKNNRPQASQS